MKICIRDRLEQLPLKYMDAHRPGDAISRITTDVEQFSDGLLLGFTQLFTGILTICGTPVSYTHLHASSAAKAENEHLLCAMLEDTACTASIGLAAAGIEVPQAARECRQLSGQMTLPVQPRMSTARSGRPVKSTAAI